MIDEATKYTDRLALEKASQMKEGDKPNPRPKEGKSVFDEMLDQGRRLNQASLNNPLENKQTSREQAPAAEKFKERFREQNKERDNKEDSKKDSKEEKREAADAGKKVVGKEGFKNKQQESGGGGAFHEGGSDKQGKRPLLSAKKGLPEMSKGIGNSPGAEKTFQTHLSPLSNALPKTFSQEVLNQLVRYVRIGLNRKGLKEVEIDLHQEVFKGLRLRLAANHGKVTVHFLTADGGVRDLFLREKPAIEEALRQKGIAVQEIQVS